MAFCEVTTGSRRKIDKKQNWRIWPDKSIFLSYLRNPWKLGVSFIDINWFTKELRIVWLEAILCHKPTQVFKQMKLSFKYLATEWIFNYDWGSDSFCSNHKITVNQCWRFGYMLWPSSEWPKRQHWFIVILWFKQNKSQPPSCSIANQQSHFANIQLFGYSFAP